MIVTEKKLDTASEFELMDKIYEIELAHTQVVSTVIVDVNEWKRLSITGFYENVASEGVTI